MTETSGDDTHPPPHAVRSPISFFFSPHLPVDVFEGRLAATVLVVAIALPPVSLARSRTPTRRQDRRRRQRCFIRGRTIAVRLGVRLVLLYPQPQTVESNYHPYLVPQSVFYRRGSCRGATESSPMFVPGTLDDCLCGAYLVVAKCTTTGQHRSPNRLNR